MKNLSIITVNYNNKNGLVKTFESVKNQTWNDFEYVVIDGGSSDGGKEIIEENKTIDYWISEKDKGIYHAMNKGIEAATGKYIIFMNSGDVFYDNNVLEKINLIFEKNYSILYGNSLYLNDVGYRKEEIVPEKLSFNYFFENGITHQATFIKRDLFFKYFLYSLEYRISSDWHFLLHTICKNNESYLQLNEFICKYDFSSINENPNNLIDYHKERALILKTEYSMFYEDYSKLSKIGQKRINKIVKITNNKFAWKVYKGFTNLVLFFMPKQN